MKNIIAIVFAAFLVWGCTDPDTYSDLTEVDASVDEDSSEFLREAPATPPGSFMELRDPSLLKQMVKAEN